MPEKIFDNITALASQICGTPIALVSLIDEKRQWFKSRHGLAATETPRDISFCGHAINHDDGVFQIENSRADSRFADNPLVTGEPRVIFYAGAPLVTGDGHKVGTLCVIDHEPKQLSDSQLQSLRQLADQVVALFELRTVGKYAADSLAEQEVIFRNSTTGLALVRGPDLVFEKVNPRFEALAGRRDYLGKRWSDVYPELRESGLAARIGQVLVTGERYEVRAAELEVRDDAGKLRRRFYDLSYTRVLDEKAGDGVLIQCTDVTADVHARDEIMRLKNASDVTNKLLQTTLSSIGDAVISTTADEVPKIRFLNRIAEKLTGWELADAAGRPVTEVFRIVNTLTREPAVDPVANVIKSGRTQGLANHTALIARDGSESIIEDSAAPLIAEDGQILGVVLVFRDVTAKQDLEDRSALLTAVVESSKDFIGIAGPDGQAFYMNPAGRRLLGLNDADVPGTRIIDYFADSEKERIAKEAVPAIRSEGAWDGRVLFKNFATGESIPFSWNAFTIESAETKGIRAIACVSKDLRETERKESIVNAEQQKLLRLLTQMPIGVCLLEGPEHRFTFANPRYYDLFRGRRDLVGKPVAEALPEIKSTELPAVLDAVFRTGVPFYGNEFPVQIADVEGHLRSLYLNFAYEPMRDVTDRIYGISVTVTDVTELVHGRKVLEQKDARLTLALTAGHIGTWDLDPITRELIWSERGADICGFYGLTRTSYETFLNRVHPGDRAMVDKNVRASTTVNGSGRYDLQYRIVLPDGRVRTIKADGQTVFERRGADQEPILFTGTVIDVTDQVTARAEILAARDLAETANTAKSAFLANMSHEIRSPLGSIMGFSDLLKSADVSRADMTEYVSVIDRNSHHLLRIIDDILDLAKVEAGKMLIESVEFSLHDLLADFTSLMAYRARDKGIEFALRVPDAIPALVITDPTRLRQILTNVVGNAIKFTEHGRVQLTVAVRDGTATFSVADTGPGLSIEQSDKLFHAFQQADVSTTRKFGGTGLGLVLTRRLAEAMGGSFELEHSSPGQGSTFVAKVRVEVPAAALLVDQRESLEFEERPRATAEVVDGRTLNGLRVLVVDDAPDNQALFKLLLTKAGAVTDIATNGLEGVHAATAKRFDVILMDVQMPVLDGHQATRRLRAEGYTGPVIALTAHAMVEERERARESGFTDFISKPVHRDTLLAMLKRFLPGDRRA